MVIDTSREFVVRVGYGGKLPTKGSKEAAGYDLYASETIIIPPGKVKAIPLSIYTQIPMGYYGRIADRSGLAFTHGLTVFGGVIDSDYRGEWKVMLHNTQDHLYGVSIGDRVAQVVLTPCANFPVVQIGNLDATERGDGGFGSTGV